MLLKMYWFFTVSLNVIKNVLIITTSLNVIQMYWLLLYP